MSFLLSLFFAVPVSSTMGLPLHWVSLLSTSSVGASLSWAPAVLGLFHAEVVSARLNPSQGTIDVTRVYVPRFFVLSQQRFVVKEKMARIHRRTVQKDLHDPVNHDGVITHLEPDVLECKVKWALESITTNKASGGDGIPVELFQILKDDAVKVLHSICQHFWKTQQWPQDWKRSVFIPIPKKGNVKECSNYCTNALISHASKVMLKILQARL